jgi:hypothetical protein
MTWLRAIIDALVQLVRELKGPLAVLFSYRAGAANERRELENAKLREELEARQRVYAVPSARGMSRNDAVAELKRRGMWDVSDVEGEPE